METITIKKIIFLLSLPIVIVIGCSHKPETAPISGPMIPSLVAEHEYKTGEEIIVTIKWPATEWKLVERQKGAFRSDDFWPFYIRINGEDYKLRSGLSPFSGLISKETLSDGLFEKFTWTQGEYRVSYVLKGINIYHPKDPENERRLEEWQSNEVIIRVVDVKDN